MKTCLFGGSFDPVHAGHLAIANAALQQCELDEIIFLPAACSPFKQNRSTYFTDEQRLQMLQLATADLPWARISELDLQLPPPSWSWRIAEIWHQNHPDTELYWLMGTDQWEQLHHWARYDYLCEMLHFIVYHRDTAPAPRPGVRSTFICTGLHPASSSEIRTALQQGKPLPLDWLHHDTATFIMNTEDLDICELPESEQEKFYRRCTELSEKEAHLSQEERYARRLAEACQLLQQSGRISANSIQRHLYTSFATASSLISDMREQGLIAPFAGSCSHYVPAESH